MVMDCFVGECGAVGCLFGVVYLCGRELVLMGHHGHVVTRIRARDVWMGGYASL
jgi:hypothetical protein